MAAPTSGSDRPASVRPHPIIRDLHPITPWLHLKHPHIIPFGAPRAARRGRDRYSRGSGAAQEAGQALLPLPVSQARAETGNNPAAVVRSTHRTYAPFHPGLTYDSRTGQQPLRRLPGRLGRRPEAITAAARPLAYARIDQR